MRSISRREALKLSAAGLTGAAITPGLGCSTLGFLGGGRETLRSLADKRGMILGSACSFHLIKESRKYREILAREFNCLVAENGMKMETVQPVRGQFDFSYADISMDFAAKHNMKVRAIPLLWHDGMPEWAVNETFARDEALGIIKEHVSTLVSHYKGRVFAWDVLNEGIGDDGPGMQNKGPWMRSVGPDYAEHAYRWAHEADPEALLFYNDFYINRNSLKAQRCYDWVKDQLAREVPIHGVGLQYHIQVDNYPKMQESIDNMKRFIDLGLIIHITELDVWLPKNYTEEHLQNQAEVYRQVFDIALSVPECPAVMVWGFWDQHSWVPYTSGHAYDDALIFDREFNPKPAYFAIRDALRG